MHVLRVYTAAFNEHLHIDRGPKSQGRKRESTLIGLIK